MTDEAIKKRISELKALLAEGNKYPNWLEVPNDVFAKYGYNMDGPYNDYISDTWYFGSVLEMIIDELEKLIEK